MGKFSWSLYECLPTGRDLNHTDFESGAETVNLLLKQAKVLVLGAGGLGCEILKNLVMMGFQRIDVVDMDRVELTNLNRQLLFAASDIGDPKAVVAARKISTLHEGCCVTGHFARIESFCKEFYKGFHLVICGLDSIGSRRWINAMLHSLLELEDDGTVRHSSVIPLIDGGTEGLKGNSRVIFPGYTSCLECNLGFFQVPIAFPICTLTRTPRQPEHCVESARSIIWEKEKPFGETEVDPSNPQHLTWVFTVASEIAAANQIAGLTLESTQNILKNTIPSVVTINSIIAATCVSEAFKLVTMIHPSMEGYLMVNASSGAYCHTFRPHRKSDCYVCSLRPVSIAIAAESSFEQLLWKLGEHTGLKMMNPMVIAFKGCTYSTIYSETVRSLRASTNCNLGKTLQELDLAESIIYVSSNSFPMTLVIRLQLL